MADSDKKPEWADSKRNVEEKEAAAPKPTPPRPSTSAQSTTSSSTRFEAHHRFVAWAALLFCSIISLAAKVTDTWDAPRATDEWFVIVVSAISIGCAFCAIMGYAIARWKFPGSVFEGLFAVVAQLAWICGMPVIMDPGRSIAVSKGTSYEAAGGTHIMLEGEEDRVAADFTYIRNANIYFFSWLSTIAIVYICGRFARAITIRHNAASWTGLWYLSTLASLVVLIDSIELFRAFDCVKDDLGSGLCLSTTYALSLGCVGTLLGFIASLLATFAMFPQWAELLLSILIFCLYMAGVTMITFNDGPGTSIGNLYFATWMGTGVAAFVLGRSYHALIQSYLHRKDQKNKKDDQKLPDDVDTGEKEEPIPFPDIEMGDGKAAKKEEEEDDEDNAKGENDVPSWVQEEEEPEADASVPPPSKGKKSKEKPKEEEGVEVEAEVPIKAKTEEPPAEKEKGKETTKKEKRNSKLKKKESDKKEEKKEADKKEEKKAQEINEKTKEEKSKPKEEEADKAEEKKEKASGDSTKKEANKGGVKKSDNNKKEAKKEEDEGEEEKE